MPLHQKEILVVPSVTVIVGLRVKFHTMFGIPLHFVNVPENHVKSRYQAYVTFEPVVANIHVPAEILTLLNHLQIFVLHAEPE